MLITAIGADWYHDDVLCVIPLNAVRRPLESRVRLGRFGWSQRGEQLASLGVMTGVEHAPGFDRVRANTSGPVNDRLDTEAQLRLQTSAFSVEWGRDEAGGLAAALFAMFGTAATAKIHGSDF